MNEVELRQANNFEIEEAKLNWSSVQALEIRQTEFRLEASVYELESKHAREILQKCKWEVVKLWDEKGLIQTALYPTRFKRIYVKPNAGIPFFMPSQINEIFPKPNKFISPKTNCNFDELKVNKGELLLTRSGTIGNCTIVSETLDGTVFSDDVIRITFKNKSDLGYVYAFLKTDVGQTLLQTNNYGSVISHIEPEHLKNVPIPEPDISIKNEISDLVFESYKLRDESNKLIEKAKHLFLKEMGLNEGMLADIEDQELAFSTKLNDLNFRLEASYHLPKIHLIDKLISKDNVEVKYLSDDSVSQGITLPGRFKRVYVEKGQGTLFFGGKQIFELYPSSEKYLSTNQHSKQLQQLKLVENMILVTRSGTVGNVNIVPKHWENWVINEHVIRIIPKDDSIAGYIFTYLNTEFGYNYITRNIYGSVVDEIDPTHVGSVKIPFLNDVSIVAEINNYVLEANKLRTKAFELELKALQVVNEKVIYCE